MTDDLRVRQRLLNNIAFYRYLSAYWANLGLNGYKEEVRLLVFDEIVLFMDYEDQHGVPDALKIDLVNPLPAYGSFSESVKNGLRIWMEWEQETLRLYQSLNQSYLCNRVSEHIKHINDRIVRLAALSYDASYTLAMQEQIRKKLFKGYIK